MRIAILALLASSGMMMNVAASQGIEDHLELCRIIPTEETRLNCYDGVAERFLDDETQLQSETEEVSEPERLAGQWRLREDRSPIDDTASVFLSVNSSETRTDRFGREFRPTLTLRCRENTTAFVINFDGQFMADSGGYGQVDIRFDDQPAREITMRESTDNQALGLWRGAQAIPLLRQIMDHERLLVRYTPFNESAGLAMFNISGATVGIRQIAAACNWSL